MNFLSRSRRVIAFILLPCFLCFDVAAADARPGMQAQEDAVRSTNVKWALKDDVIIINYDLVSSPDDRYKVDVLMRRENDEAFKAEPVTVEGDIGIGLFAGTNREIRWYFRRDFPQGFVGEGYYFEIRVDRIKQGSNWLYYALGAAAVAGGVAVYFITRTQENPPAGQLPLPPGRP